MSSRRRFETAALAGLDNVGGAGAPTKRATCIANMSTKECLGVKLVLSYYENDPNGRSWSVVMKVVVDRELTTHACGLNALRG